MCVYSKPIVNTLDEFNDFFFPHTFAFSFFILFRDTSKIVKQATIFVHIFPLTLSLSICGGVDKYVYMVRILCNVLVRL